MLEREEGNPPTKPQRVGEDEVGIPRRDGRALGVRDPARPRRAPPPRSRGPGRSPPRPTVPTDGRGRVRGASPRKRRSASGSPAASSGAVWRAMAQAASTVCAIDSVREVRRARVAAPLAEIDGHRERLVAVVLDGLHLPQPHGDRLADGGGGFGLGVARAARAGESPGREARRIRARRDRGEAPGRRACRACSWGQSWRAGSRARAAKTSKLRRARRACDRRSTTR